MYLRFDILKLIKMRRRQPKYAEDTVTIARNLIVGLADDERLQMSRSFRHWIAMTTVSASRLCRVAQYSHCGHEVPQAPVTSRLLQWHRIDFCFYGIGSELHY